MFSPCLVTLATYVTNVIRLIELNAFFIDLTVNLSKYWTHMNLKTTVLLSWVVCDVKTCGQVYLTAHISCLKRTIREQSSLGQISVTSDVHPQLLLSRVSYVWVSDGTFEEFMILVFTYLSLLGSISILTDIWASSSTVKIYFFPLTKQITAEHQRTSSAIESL